MAPTAAPPWVVADLSGSVLWLTLSRPGQRNPLSSQMIKALTDALAAAEADAAVRCVVITGSGPAFSAGHDLREMTPQAGESDADCRARMQAILQACSRLMLGITESPKAVIACVQGVCTRSPSPVKKRVSASPGSISGLSALRRWLRWAAISIASMRWSWL